MISTGKDGWPVSRYNDLSWKYSSANKLYVDSDFISCAVWFYFSICYYVLSTFTYKLGNTWRPTEAQIRQTRNSNTTIISSK